MDHSFDIVSTVDYQEVTNGIHQTEKEVSTRFDLKDSASTIALNATENALTIESADAYKAKSVFEILQQRLQKRGIHPTALDPGEPVASLGGRVRQTITIHNGIEKDVAKKITTEIKGMGLKVQASVQGDQIRVSGKKIDELQVVITTLRDKSFGIPLQFVNLR